MNKIDRYKILIRHLINLGIIESQKDLGVKMGYSNPSAFSQVINGKTSEPKLFANKLANLYPSLNLNWLLTGEGSMILGEENAVQQKQEPTESKGDFVRVKIHDDHVHYTYINRNHVYAVREEADRITVYMTNGDNYTIYEDFKRVLSDLLR